MKKGIIISLIGFGILTGCYRDNEETLYPANGSCDVSNVTYQQTVALLLQQQGCISCHSGAAPSGNIPLDTYNGVRAVAQNGRLFGTISHTPGYSPMPKGGSKMSICNINKIKAWIDAGSNNN